MHNSASTLRVNSVSTKINHGTLWIAHSDLPSSLIHHVSSLSSCFTDTSRTVERLHHIFLKHLFGYSRERARQKMCKRIAKSNFANFANSNPLTLFTSAADREVLPSAVPLAQVGGFTLHRGPVVGACGIA